jgi:hypothetical protein
MIENTRNLTENTTNLTENTSNLTEIQKFWLKYNKSDWKWMNEEIKIWMNK